MDEPTRCESTSCTDEKAVIDPDDDDDDDAKSAHESDHEQELTHTDSCESKMSKTTRKVKKAKKLTGTRLRLAKAKARKKSLSEREFLEIGTGKGAFAIDEKILPGSVEASRNILARHCQTHLGKHDQALQKARRSALPKDLLTFDEFLESQDDFWTKGEGKNYDKARLKIIHDAVQQEKEEGISGSRLKQKCGAETCSAIAQLESDLLFLLEHWQLLRSGVVSARFIALPFAQPWLLHSFHMVRKTREDSSLDKMRSKLMDVDREEHPTLSLKRTHPTAGVTGVEEGTIC